MFKYGSFSGITFIFCIPFFVAMMLRILTVLMKIRILVFILMLDLGPSSNFNADPDLAILCIEVCVTDLKYF